MSGLTPGPHTTHAIVADDINTAEGRNAAIAYACDITDRELVYSIVKDAEEEVGAKRQNKSFRT